MISRKALEVILLSLALIAMIKASLSSHSYGLVFSSSWNSINRLLSSHLCICIIINFMVLLIVASSKIKPINPVKEETIATNPKEEDAMEMINGDENLDPKRKHLEKSETWDMPNVVRWKELRKSETFNDCVLMGCRGGLIRQDPSTSLGEFNEQVEAFIKKFNDDMKLHRQESDKRF